jgi:uroporphyrin-III C-methyltransferase/precorrin-2 dehydrogenase/sirohydrochlorin ferrochelatase
MGDLNTFPLSYRVRGKRIVIVGGGDEALNKARLAIKTTAEVVIVSPEISTDFPGCTVIARAFRPSDLDGAALCFVADHGEDGRAAMQAARERGVPLNVVDVPGECDFYTPAIIDRAPLTVAVSTEGDAPVLARLVRAKIEAMLAPEIGRLARLAGSLRDTVARVLTKPQARRFYEDLVTSDGEPDVGKLLETHVAGARMGVVWLIGAGPGAEDLLTLRAQRLLQEADVIVHDHLVPDAVVQMGRRDAERISVGKKMGHHSFTQAQINALLVRLAGQGRRVARLKGGDPMVFGRAGEETAALRKAGIAYSIVPGVSAALAAAADTGTPLTLRNVSSGIVFATAHGASNEQLRHWGSLAASGLTLCLYMGKQIAASTAINLIVAGVPSRMPVGLVVNAGRRDRTLHRGTLGELADGVHRFADGPAIIFVGEAVAAGDWHDAAALAEAQFKVA